MYDPFNKEQERMRIRKIIDYALGITGAAIFSALVYTAGREGCYKTDDIMQMIDRVSDRMERKDISYQEAVKELSLEMQLNK